MQIFTGIWDIRALKSSGFCSHYIFGPFFFFFFCILNSRGFSQCEISPSYSLSSKRFIHNVTSADFLVMDGITFPFVLLQRLYQFRCKPNQIHAGVQIQKSTFNMVCMCYLKWIIYILADISTLLQHAHTMKTRASLIKQRSDECKFIGWFYGCKLFHY